MSAGIWCNVLSGHLALWHRAVMVQRDRVLNTDEAHALDRQMDAMQFVIALRNFVRAVEAIQALGGAQSGKALGTFTEAVPRWKHVRDVIEHFDKYEAGNGNLQSDGQLEGLSPFYVSDNARYLIGLAPGLQLEVATAAAAADALLHVALHDTDMLTGHTSR
jgi:hypothetical protein